MANPAETDTTKTEVANYGWNGTSFRELNIDASTRAQTIIEYEHHEIHGGSTYSIVDIDDIAISSVIDLQLFVANTKKWPHFFFSFGTEKEVEWYLYRGVTAVTTGVACPCYNSNHNVSTTAGMSVNKILNSSLANAESDTDTSGAVIIYHGISGAGQKGGGYDHGHEIILQQNTVYTVRFIAGAAGYVNYHLDWYEHTDKNETGDMW